MLTGHDLLRELEQGRLTLEDVAEFIVRPVDPLGAYIDLIDSFLEVEHHTSIFLLASTITETTASKSTST